MPLSVVVRSLVDENGSVQPDNGFRRTPLEDLLDPRTGHWRFGGLKRILFRGFV